MSLSLFIQTSENFILGFLEACSLHVVLNHLRDRWLMRWDEMALLLWLQLSFAHRYTYLWSSLMNDDQLACWNIKNNYKHNCLLLDGWRRLDLLGYVCGFLFEKWHWISWTDGRTDRWGCTQMKAPRAGFIRTDEQLPIWWIQILPCY